MAFRDKSKFNQNVNQDLPANSESQPRTGSFQVRIESHGYGERRTPRIHPRMAQEHRPRKDDRGLYRSPRHHARSYLPGPTPHDRRTSPDFRHGRKEM